MAMKMPSSLSKIAPASKGFIQNSVTGIGAAGLLQTVDNFVGAPMQRFGIVIPVLGIRISFIDFLNYTIHAKGLKLSKNGLIAVGASKMVQGTLSLGTLSGLGTNKSIGGVGGSPTASSGISGGGL